MVAIGEEGHTARKLKLGWNWGYTFCEKKLPDGSRRTLVVEYLLHCRKWGTDVIVSNYPGAHHYEDAAFDAIGDTFRDFFHEAHVQEVVWQEVRWRVYYAAWLLDAPIDSGLIKAFAAALAGINRVTVKVNEKTEG